MAVTKQGLDDVFAQAQRLSPEDRLRLIQRLTETLVPSVEKTTTPHTAAARYLVYGQFHGKNMSTGEDFVIAEWRPTEQELDGV